MIERTVRIGMGGEQRIDDRVCTRNAIAFLLTRHTNKQCKRNAPAVAANATPMKTSITQTVIPATANTPQLQAVTANAGGAPAVVAPPHPLYGGSIAIPAVVAVFDALADAGFAPLAFNWRGVGSSGGSASGSLEDAVADYRAAAAHAAGSGALIAAGYSWGAAAALMVAADTPGIERLILIAPPIAMIEDRSVLDTGRPMYVVAGSDDMFAPRTLLEEAVGPIAGATLDIIEGADHFFSSGGIEELQHLIRVQL